MKYLKGVQFVPAKGEALMFYECQDDGTILRQCTYLTGTGESTKTDRPVVKRVFRPESLLPSTAEEFESYWIR